MGQFPMTIFLTVEEAERPRRRGLTLEYITLA